MTVPVESPRLFEVPAEVSGRRLDHFLSDVLEGLSRSQVQRSIRMGLVEVDGVQAWKNGMVLRGGEEVEFTPPPPQPVKAEPEEIPLDILHRDEHLLVVNKPPGMVVHPAAGHPSGTLVNALLGYDPELSGLGPLRPGLVHRLDRGTSGVIVVARTPAAREHLSAQFLARTVFKGYLALVLGIPRRDEGKIDRPIARHPGDRKRFSSKGQGGRPSVTLWRRVASVSASSLLALRILTGRTHQIRVHLSDEGYPVVGDTLYCPSWAGRADRALRRGDAGAGTRALKAAFSQGPMLHAALIELVHPACGSPMCFHAPLPPRLETAGELLFQPDWSALRLHFGRKSFYPRGDT